MERWLKPLVDTVGGVLSGYPLVIALLGAGLYFTVRFGGIQVRALWHSICLLRTSGSASGISPFRRLPRDWRAASARATSPGWPWR